MSEEYKINQFIDKESFNNLSKCIAIVVALTEIFKICFSIIDPRILAIIFSFLVSFSRIYLNSDIDKTNIKEAILIGFFNIIPIALGSMGAYDIILKIILQNFGV